MSDLSAAEERIQALANVLSLVAIVGSIDKAAVQRVLISLGSDLVSADAPTRIDPGLTARLLAEIAREDGEQAALRVAADLSFVAAAWKPVLDEHFADDPHRLMPYAEIIFALFNHSGHTLHSYDVFRRFGGPDQVLPMPQLTAALNAYPVPLTGLVWEMVGFEDPADHAFVASSADAMFIFKAASSHIALRFSELDRGDEAATRREHDVQVDAPLFAAGVAGLLGDMLYWAARLRAGAQPGQQTWRRLKAILHSASS